MPQSLRSDRRRGDMWPLFRTEQELALYRGAARYLAETNPFALGFLQGLTSYVIGTGITFRASSKDRASAELVALTQDVIDEFVDPYGEVGWPELSAELFVRSRVDGEYLLRHGLGDDGLTWVRTIEPEQLTQPLDEDAADWSYGIRTPHHDVQKHEAYWVAYLDDEGKATDGEELDPDEVIHCRINTPRSVKRGLTDFHHGTLEALDVAGKLVKCVGHGAAIQAATAEIWAHESSVKADVQRLVTDQTDYTLDRTYPDRERTSRYQTVEPGAVRHVPKGMVPTPLPTSQAPQHVEALRACLQAAGRRWSAPSWLATGASEDMAAYTAAMVAESPFVRWIERQQHQVYARHELKVVWSVVRNAVKAGRLPPAVLERVTIQAEPPAVQMRNKLEESQRDQVYVGLGVKSRQTCAQEQGLDWEQESVNIHEYEQEHGVQGPPLDQAPDEPPAPGGAPPGPFDEARRLREEAGTCKRGERSDLTGCTPASADAPATAAPAPDISKRKHETVTSPKDWGNQHYRDWAAGLNDDERAAIGFYKDDSTPINEVLRADTHFRNSNTEKHAKNLDKLVRKSSVPHDLVVFRGARAEFYDNLYEGRVFRDKGFVSTSVSKDTMDTFGDPHGEGHKVVKIAIMVPRGSRGAYLSQVDNSDSTDELLLPRNSKFRVLKMKSNRIVLKLIPKRPK